MRWGQCGSFLLVTVACEGVFPVWASVVPSEKVGLGSFRVGAKRVQIPSEEVRLEP